MPVHALASMQMALSLLMALSLAGACSRASSAAPSANGEQAHALPARGSARAREAELPTLALTDLLEPGATLKPSLQASAFAEKRVRLVGFMADMEHLSTDALYLVPRPIHCDEGGGGTGDLPPDAVLVTVSDTPPQELVHLTGPVEAVGVFSIGNRADEHGRVANFRLRLDADSLRKAL